MFNTAQTAAAISPFSSELKTFLYIGGTVDLVCKLALVFAVMMLFRSVSQWFDRH
jgi:hypothetical protein